MITTEKETKKKVDEGKELILVEEREIEATMNSISIEGINTPKTMKVLGLVNGIDLLVFLDNGATHNFISKKLVSKLSVLVQPTKFVIVLRDNKKVNRLGKCDKVVVFI